MSTTILSYSCPETIGKSLGEALGDLESEFVYPLGDHDSFRICHGLDYSLFYRAMGENVTFAAFRQGELLGTISASLRSAFDQNRNQIKAAYIGDLKVRQSGGTGRTSLALLYEVYKWSKGLSSYAFAIVMDGTSRQPDSYTGRLGLPKFAPVRKTFIFEITCDRDNATVIPVCSDKQNSVCSDEQNARKKFRELTRSGFSIELGESQMRSLTPAYWLITSDGAACACVEDTRNAKKLIATRGGEIRAAHLSNFAFTDLRSAVTLIELAKNLAAANGFSTLFFCVDELDKEELKKSLDQSYLRISPATIYASEPLIELVNGQKWFVHSSEI